ncbi:Ig domain-containing protein [Corynebacterium mucifaciens]
MGVKPELTGGKLPDGLTFKDGKITGTPTKAGDFKVTFTTKDESGKDIDTREVTFKISEAAKPAESREVDEKCLATSLGFGLPLLALIPVGMATQVELRVSLTWLATSTRSCRTSTPDLAARPVQPGGCSPGGCDQQAAGSVRHRSRDRRCHPGTDRGWHPRGSLA